MHTALIWFLWCNVWDACSILKIFVLIYLNQMHLLTSFTDLAMWTIVLTSLICADIFGFNQSLRLDDRISLFQCRHKRQARHIQFRLKSQEVKYAHCNCDLLSIFLSSQYAYNWGISVLLPLLNHLIRRRNDI